jgi:lipoxygenase
MFTVNPGCSPKPDIATPVLQKSPVKFSGAGKSRRSRLRVPSSRVNGKGSIRAVISSGDKTLEAASPLESKEESNNGSLVSSRGGIEVRAVVTVRKKMKEKITEKMEDQWEFFVNGFGQGIIIQLISQEIDPG